jgi:hypothetical protein
MWGWYLEEDFSGTRYAPGSVVYGGLINSTIFYARWGAEPYPDGSSMAKAIPLFVDKAETVKITKGGQYVYFKFIPTETRTYTFQSYIMQTQYDPYGHLYDSAGSLIASNDDGAGSLQFKITYTCAKDVVYYLGATMTSGS